MRTFIVKLNHPLEKFELNNLPQNRMDLVARCINSAFWLGHGLRNDITMYFCFSNGKAFYIDSKIKKMWPDERNVCSYIQKTLEGRKFPGIKLLEKSFGEVIAEHADEKTYFLERGGIDIFVARPEENAIFVLGDDKGIEIPKNANVICIGSNAYLTSHCITVVNNFLDRTK